MNEGPWRAGSEVAGDSPSIEGARGQAACSAGGVLIVRTTESGPRLAALEAGGLVSLPRAEVGPGESAETAARRAAQFFVGVDVRLTESIGETTDVIDGREVYSWYWLGRARLGALLRPETQPPPGFTLHWLDFEEALDALGSEGECELVARLAARPHPPRRRILASDARRALTQELEAFRDNTASQAAATEDPARLEALLRARDEIGRAEARLARGDDAGARRARARAERETLAALDGPARVISLRRALSRLAPDDRTALGVAIPAEGDSVPFEALLAVHTAVDAALQEQERVAATRRNAQLHATLAIAAATIGVIVLASYGLFQAIPTAGGTLVTFGAGVLAAVFVLAGALGGWVGESIHALRESDRSRRVGLPLGTAAGALAGLALGALLTGGFAGVPAGTGVAFTLACAFAAGWVGRLALK